MAAAPLELFPAAWNCSRKCCAGSGEIARGAVGPIQRKVQRFIWNFFCFWSLSGSEVRDRSHASISMPLQIADFGIDLIAFV
jgi:hypothetical protein